MMRVGEELARPSRLRRLLRNELPIDTVDLARFLIGKTLVHDVSEGRMSGRIVETEAYVPGDAACHAFRGPTPRNGSLFLRRGHAYVYLIYGSSFMLNVTAEVAGVGAGVLLRALEPIEGVELMRYRRDTQRLIDLTRGPGRLAQAMWIEKESDGSDLCGGGSLWLATAVQETRAIGTSKRIGLTREVDRPLRFYEKGNRFVSGPGSLNKV